MNKVGIYLRLSDEDKNKTNRFDDSESIKNQRYLLLEEINKRPDFILVDEYCDEDLSGAGTYRPEFERLINDCKNGKLDVVLCKSQSRFSRDMEIIEKYLHNKFIEWNVRFISLSDNADTKNIGNKKARQINGLVNEWYLEDISNNIRSAFNAKMKQGEFISPFACFGYMVSKENNNRIIIDPYAAEIVKTIFNLYIKGLGFTSIANYLNKNNIPSPSFYKYQKGIKLNIVSNKPRELIKWSANSIKTILSNEIYIGNLIQGKRTTISYKNHKIKKKNIDEWIKCENTHDAIIDKETFGKVQNIIKQRKKSIKTGTVHNFSGKVFCAECGYYLRKKNSGKHDYLFCPNIKCNNKSMRYDILEEIILNKINDKIKNNFDKKFILTNIDNFKKNVSINKIETLKKQVNDINNKIYEIKKYKINLYEDKVNNIISTEQFKELFDNYTKNETYYINQIKNINNDINKLSCNNNTDIEKSIINYKDFKYLNKVIIDEFIDKIYIGLYNENTRNIMITWNFN